MARVERPQDGEISFPYISAKTEYHTGGFSEGTRPKSNVFTQPASRKPPTKRAVRIISKPDARGNGDCATVPFVRVARSSTGAASAFTRRAFARAITHREREAERVINDLAMTAPLGGREYSSTRRDRAVARGCTICLTRERRLARAQRRQQCSRNITSLSPSRFTLSPEFTHKHTA